MNLEKLLINKNDNLKNALKLIDNNAKGVLFVIDNKKKMVGIITDGDIRRFLLNNSFNSNILASKIMTKNFISLPNNVENIEIISSLNNKIRIIPLLDKNNIIVDYATPNRLRKINISSPFLSGNEMLYLSECVRTNWISSQGKYVRLFEKQFKDYHSNYEALAVSNGTVALHLALVSLGIGKGDEVIVPNLTFAASINSIIYTGATPVLVDVEKDTFNIDVKKIKSYISSKTKAIMPVHLYGHPCDMNSIINIANKNNLFVVEDCAEAIGSKYNNKPVGVFGDAASFSFFGNKTITTGEGGMVIFKDPKVAAKAAVLRDHGMSKTKRYWHDEIGFNYRLTNLQAAIGVAQFEKLNQIVESKRKIAEIYNEKLNQYSFLQLPIEKTNTFNTYWLYTFLVCKKAPFSRDELMGFLNKNDIETRPVFYPLNIMPIYKEYALRDDFSVSFKISKQGLSLPSAVNLSRFEQNLIIARIVEFIDSKL